MRIKEKLSCERDQIRLAGTKNLLRMPRLGDQTDSDRFDARLPSHTLCIRNVITRHSRHDFCIDWAAYSPRRTGYDVNAAMRQFACKHNCVVHRPASFRTIRRRATEKQRPILWPYRTHCLCNFEGKPHAAFQIAAVGIVTAVREGTEELVYQVPMRAMDLTNIESRIDTTKSGIAPHSDHILDIPR